MNNELIIKFVETQKITAEKCVKIDFKKRGTIFGQIVRASDYEDLKSKNFWRIVQRSNMEAWLRTNNMDFAKIYSGGEFTRLTLVVNKELV